MLNRNKKTNDPNEGKWIGVGGHLEKNETPYECILREVREETGITLGSVRLRGTVFFYSDSVDDECMFVYTAGYDGDVSIECDEGTLEWVQKDRLFSLPMWEGDRKFLELLLNDSEYFCMRLCYEGYKLADSITYPG